MHFPRERNSGDRRVITALCGTHLNDLYRVAIEGVDCCDCQVKLRNRAIDSANRKGMKSLATRLMAGLPVERWLNKVAKAVGWIPNEHGV